MWPVALILLAFVNLVTIVVWRHDKLSAMAGLRRVPEAKLLGLAAIGGTPAAFLARSLYRHKTRKQPFSTWLVLIAAAQAGVVFAFAVP